jgi:hypothetical protein
MGACCNAPHATCCLALYAQCREKYKNDLRPDISKAPWTTREEYILARAHAVVGNQWAEIAKLLPGRSENSWVRGCRLVGGGDALHGALPHRGWHACILWQWQSRLLGTTCWLPVCVFAPLHLCIHGAACCSSALRPRLRHQRMRACQPTEIARPTCTISDAALRLLCFSSTCCHPFGPLGVRRIRDTSHPAIN